MTAQYLIIYILSMKDENYDISNISKILFESLIDKRLRIKL